MPPFNPEAEKEYFSRGIARGDYTPFNGLFFNDPANDRSKRTWYDEYGRVVPGFGTAGPAGPYEQAGSGEPSSIAQIMNDLTLQRIAKTFDWQGDDLPGIKSFKEGGYWWSDDPANAFAVPRQNVTLPGMVQQMIRSGGGGGRWNADDQWEEQRLPNGAVRRRRIPRGGTSPVQWGQVQGGTPAPVGINPTPFLGGGKAYQY